MIYYKYNHTRNQAITEYIQCGNKVFTSLAIDNDTGRIRIVGGTYITYFSREDNQAYIRLMVSEDMASWWTIDIASLAPSTQEEFLIAAGVL